MSQPLPNNNSYLIGFAERRARRLLYLMESRTAEALQSHTRSMTRFSLERVTEETDLDFYDALSQHTLPPLTITAIERYTQHWASFIPDSPHIRAVLLRLLAEKYEFIPEQIPNILKVLAVETAPVQESYQHLYQRPLSTVFPAAPKLATRMWLWADAFANRLENLPPFWIAYIVILTEILGGGILALPIATAEIGAWGGVLLVVLLGCMSLLTMLYMGEAVIRNGSLRYQGAYLGRVVEDYLGRVGMWVFTLAVVSVLCVALLVYAIGLGQTLHDAIGFPAWFWVALQGMLCLYLIRSGSLSSTLGVGLLIGGINIGLLLLLMLLGLPHFEADYLNYSRIPFIDTPSLEPAVLNLAFGVILLAFWGHTALGNVAQLTLHRDPSGRSLMRGIVAAQFTAMGLYSLWIVVMSGVLNPETLQGSHQTVLVPLSAKVGGIAQVVGVLFSGLSMGLVSVYLALALFNLMRERLPIRTDREVFLYARHGQLLLRPRLISNNRGVTVSVVYLGLRDRKPQFRFDIQNGDQHYHEEREITQPFDLRTMLGNLPLRVNLRGIDWRMTISVADQERVKFRMETGMLVRCEFDWDQVGLRVAAVLDLSEEMRSVLNWLVRQNQFTAAELTAHLQQPPEQIAILLDDLLSEGFIRMVTEGEQVAYRIRLAAKRGSRLSDGIWVALGKSTQTEKAPPPGSWLSPTTLFQRVAIHPIGRFLLSSSLIGAVFMLAIILLALERDNFTAPLGYIGTLAAPIVMGFFGCLLLKAARAKGDLIPSVKLGWVASLGVMGVVYGFFVLMNFLYGFIIWDEPLAQIAALFTGLFLLMLTGYLVWEGMTKLRLVIQIQEPILEHLTYFRSHEGDKPFPLPVFLSYSLGEKDLLGDEIALAPMEQLRTVTFALPANIHEVKLWIHRLDVESMSQPVAAMTTVKVADRAETYDLSLTNGQILTHLPPLQTEWTLTFPVPAQED